MRVIVRGEVQGVGFRWFTRDAAVAAGVAGWVRNRRDGSVEAVLRGSADAVDTVIDAMREGPGHARVVELATMPEPEPDASAQGFDIRPTG